MKLKIIVLGLISGLIGLGGLERNSFAEENYIKEAVKGEVEPSMRREGPKEEISQSQTPVIVEEETISQWPEEIQEWPEEIQATPLTPATAEEVRREPPLSLQEIQEVESQPLPPTLTEEVRRESPLSLQEIQEVESQPLPPALTEEVKQEPQLSKEEIRDREEIRAIIIEEWKERLKKIKPPAKPEKSEPTPLTEKKKKVRIEEPPKSK